ncbi:hypothetical protein EDB85DRAFT_2281302 [Lactarius pseudohatsudake]|nr:hypothetical protein EDB85DRAFT_2281302 [Lactarius pseudohatsudake]
MSITQDMMREACRRTLSKDLSRPLQFTSSGKTLNRPVLRWKKVASSLLPRHLTPLPPKDSPSQAVGNAALTDSDADDVPTLDVEPDAVSGTLPPSTPARLQSPAIPCAIPHHNPACPLKSAAALASLTPLASAYLQHPVPTPSRPLSMDAAAGAAARKGAGGSAGPMTPEMAQRQCIYIYNYDRHITTVVVIFAGGSMSTVDDAPSSASASFLNVKRPFRPPRVQVPTKSQSQQQQWKQKEVKEP